MGDDVDFVPDVDSPTPEAAPGFETKPPHVQVEDEPHIHDEPPIRRITPRPSFLENLADSRDRQFMLHRRASTDVDRYFVCFASPSNWRDTTNGWIAWPSRPRQTLQMAHLPPSAWQRSAQTGPPHHLRCPVVDPDYVHFAICPEP